MIRFARLFAVVAAIVFAAMVQAATAPSAPYNGQPPDPSKWAWSYSDFQNGLQTQDPQYAATVSGSGASATVDSGIQHAAHPAMLNVQTGLSTTGRAAIATRAGNWHYAGSTARIIIRSPTALSAVGDRYAIRLGFSDVQTGLDGTAGVFVRYTDTENSGKWNCVARASSVDTTVDSGVTVATSTYYDVLIRQISASSATISINGATVCTLSSGLPGAALYVQAGIVKSTGTTNITMLLDLIDVRQALSR